MEEFKLDVTNLGEVLDARRTFKPYYNIGLSQTVCLDYLHIRPFAWPKRIC